MSQLPGTEIEWGWDRAVTMRQPPQQPSLAIAALRILAATPDGASAAAVRDLAAATLRLLGEQ